MGLGRGTEAAGCTVTGMHKATPTRALHTRTHRVTLTLSYFHALPYAHRCTPTPAFSRDYRDVGGVSLMGQGKVGPQKKLLLQTNSLPLEPRRGVWVEPKDWEDPGEGPGAGSKCPSRGSWTCPGLPCPGGCSGPCDPCPGALLSPRGVKTVVLGDKGEGKDYQSRASVAVRPGQCLLPGSGVSSAEGGVGTSLDSWGLCPHIHLCDIQTCATFSRGLASPPASQERGRTCLPSLDVLLLPARAQGPFSALGFSPFLCPGCNGDRAEWPEGQGCGIIYQGVQRARNNL